ncbi:MAG: hypothetical protein A2V77_08265 [Anaeromyxobacter sp. RBG_16_69_14]|nr:MAG: hypothetical protein A2V77_08265 [Anaeromyxobacter sp. RBG_16_69_14]
MHSIVLLAAALAAGSEPAVERMTSEELQRWLQTYEVEHERSPSAEIHGRIVHDRREPGAHSDLDARDRAGARTADPGPEQDQLLASALACYADDTVSAARAAIRAERAAAKSSGVANLTNLFEQKTRTERAERTKLAQFTELREKGLRPLPCSRPDVAHFVACMRGMDSVSATDWCDDSAWQEFHERQDLYAQIDLQ